MSADNTHRYAPVIETYDRLEPPGTDTWNPIVRERELIHRIVLYEQVCRALRRSPTPPPELRVMDVGCGTGRSTRMYLDFGVEPERLMGVDLRPGALELARRSHPGIRFEHCDGERLPADDGALDWVSLCTVLSSVAGAEARAHLFSEIARVLAPGGCLFYWDRDQAHGFAGGDPLLPERLLPGWTVRYYEHVCVYGRIERLLPQGRAGALLARALRRIGPPPSHRAALLQRPR